MRSDLLPASLLSSERDVERDDNSELAASRRYWQERLSGAPPLLELPADHPRRCQPTWSGRTLFRTLPRPLSSALSSFSSERKTTLFVTLLSAFQVLLHRYTGQDDLVVGTTVAHRDRTDLRGPISFHANTVALRTDLSDSPSFAELLMRSEQVLHGALRHSHLSFEEVVQELGIDRNPSYPPLVQVVFDLHDVPLQLPAIDVKRLAVDPGATKFDLTLTAVNQPDGLGLSLEYNSDLFQHDTIERLCDHYHQLLEAVVEDPQADIARIPILLSAERELLLHKWNQAPTTYPRDKCIQCLFEEQVEQTPDAVAIVSGDRRLTYRDLNRQANQLAHYLQSLGVGRETPVAICIDRSIETIIGLLAILKAGGAYVPLDPEYPPQRLMLMLTDTEAPVLLTTEGRSSLFSEYSGQLVVVDADTPVQTFAAHNPSRSNGPTDLAYVMYTSGSTGQPKGVGIVHRGVVRLVKHTNYACFDAQSAFLQLAPLAFDASTFEIWGPLLNGGRLVIAPPGLLTLAEIGACVRRHQVTTLWLTAGLFHQMVEHQLQDFKCIRQLLAGGDVLSPAHVRKAITALPDCQIINGYGPTENTTFTCCCPLDDLSDVEHRVAIGRPIANTDVYVLDKAGQLAPIGVPGELYIGGDGLARSYWRQPELTRQKFVTRSLGSGRPLRLYRSGDRVRWRADGCLEFLGRFDEQVKIRGFRIEPGEIEHTLKLHPSVDDVVVQPRADSRGTRQLVAYVIATPPHSLTSKTLREFLGRRLPAYMVPANFVFLTEFPLNLNGKVDRRALPKVRQSTDEPLPIAPPRNALEDQVRRLWEQVLGVEGIGIHHTFVELGGDSLRAIQLASRIQDMFQVDLGIGHFFPQGTIATQASAIEHQQRIPRISSQQPLAKISADRPVPLSYPQQRLWFLHQFDPQSRAYTIALAYRLTGVLDGELLARCMRIVSDRHDVLRTTFASVGGVGQQRIGPTGEFHLERFDFRDLSGSEREARLRHELATAARHRFNLEQGPLLRATLVRLDDEEHALLWTVHHIIFDGWSEGLLFRELAALYRAFAASEPSPLGPLPFQYADFAAWQRDQQEVSRRESERSYWKAQLTGAPSLLELPADHSRPHRPTGAGRTVFRTLPESLSSALRALSSEQETTLFVTLLAAFQVLIYRHTEQEDLVIGSAVAQRDRTDLEGLLGFFANTVALRTDLSGNPPFAELLKRAEQVLHGALDHSHLPFEEVVQELGIDRNSSYPPLVQLVFVLHDVPIEFPGIEVERLPVDTGTAKFDLTLTAVTQQQGIGLWFEYNSDLFRHETIERLGDQYQRLLEAIVGNPRCTIQQLAQTNPTERQISPSVKTEQSRFISESRATDPQVECKITTIWRQLLGVDSIGRCDDFFDAGGHSLLAVELAAQLASQFGRQVSVAQLFQHRTIAAQSQLVGNQEETALPSSIITVRSGPGLPLVLLPNIDGGAFSCGAMLRHLSTGLPLIAIDLKGQTDNDALSSVEDLASVCVRILRHAKIPPPYRLLGYSFGGMLAYEVARQLEAMGCNVDFVGLIDAGPARPPRRRAFSKLRDLQHFVANAPFWIADKFQNRQLAASVQRGWKRLRRRIAHQHSNRDIGIELPYEEDELPYALRGASDEERRIRGLRYRAYLSYVPGDYGGKVALFRARVRPLFHHFTPDAGWFHMPIGSLEIHHLPGSHTSVLEEPQCQVLARAIQAALNRSA